ncbi:MAG TPA: twin-arginine translocation signal domain-containing protein [Acidobacteriota bacterium]|nr:twin-arginine translocation signal domain-containing protein [Acidobacteriota bacterium]
MAKSKGTPVLSRRLFLKGAATGAVAGSANAKVHSLPDLREESRIATNLAAAGPASVKVQGGRIFVDTGTLSSVIEKGFLILARSGMASSSSARD